MKIYRTIFVFCIILFLGFTTSCDLFTDSDLKDLGTLTIELNDQINARSTLVPELSMDPSDYIITGVGPEGRSFDPVSLSGVTESITGLYKGTWVITVTAVNADEDEIGIGTVTVEIEPNRTKTAHVTVVPIAGEGTLTLSGGWVAGDIADPHILAELINSDGDIEILEFTITDNTAEFSSDTIQAGYYTLRLGLYDGPSNEINNKLMGTVVAVRIVVGHETRGILQVTSEDLNVAGSVSLTIINDIRNPYDVSLTRSASSVFEGRNLTISASVTPAGDYSYEWYLNGDLLDGETAESITLGEDLRVGKHFVDVIVSGNGVISSASTAFTIVEQLGGYVSFALTPNNDSDVLEYYLTAGLEGDIDIYEDGTVVSFDGIPVGYVVLIDDQILGFGLISSDKPIAEDSMGGGYVHDEDLVRFYLESWTEDSVTEWYVFLSIQEGSDFFALDDKISVVIDDYGSEGTYITGSFTGSELQVYERYFNEDWNEYDYREIEGLTYSLVGEFNVLRFLDLHFYYVTYDDNGADRGEPPYQSEYFEGEEVGVRSNYYDLEKDGYVFAGWNTKADGTGTTYQPNDRFIMGSEHVTLYAVWEEPFATFIGPSGGVVFYENPNWETDGWRYLEAAPYGWHEEGTSDPWIEWGGYGTLVGGTSRSIGTGKANTDAIIEEIGSGIYAAKICAEYSVTVNEVTYDDWFLPSADELNLMYRNMYLQDIGKLSDWDYYWSSSEINATLAWSQYFDDGSRVSGNKSSGDRVRPVRAF